MRTIVELPEEQLEALDALCRREKISRAEGIRRAVAVLVRQRAAGAGRAFGLWRDRPEDGLAYQRRMRKEWDAAPARRRSR
ncbi:MAG: ribbon-helix-helix protein, CopG family [Vicinamibacterales bacterium]